MLEIGTGSGLIALTAAMAGANVTAIDISEKAVENALINFSRNKAKGTIFVSHLYDALDETTKYDYIFWNHPFNRGSHTEQNIFMRSVFDFEYRDLDEYISKAKKYLNENGHLFLGTGSIANITAIKEIARRYKYHLKLISKINSPSEVDDSIQNDYRIYELITTKALK